MNIIPLKDERKRSVEDEIEEEVIKSSKEVWKCMKIHPFHL